MFKKICDRCHQPSYSSSERGNWICPICNQDITHVMHQNPGNQAEVKLRYHAFKNRFTANADQNESFNEYV